MKFKDLSFQDHLLGVVLAGFYALPQNILLYLFVPIGFFLIVDKKKSINVPPLQSLLSKLCLLLICCAVINFPLNGLLMNDLFRIICTFILFFCLSKKMKATGIHYYYILATALYLVASQFTYLIHIPGLTDWFNAVYPIDEEHLNIYAHLENMSLDDVGAMRMGGIFHNPNIYGQYITSLLCLAIVEKDQFPKFIFWPFIAVLTYSCYATGSRTCLLILLSVLAYEIYIYKKQTFLIWIGIAAVCFVLLLPKLGDARMLEVESGMNGSFGVKWDILLMYITDYMNPLSFLIGLGNLKFIPHSDFAGTDFDLGNVLIAYGIIYYIVLLKFLYRLYKYFNRECRVFFCTLLWCFSNCYFLSYRGNAVLLLLFMIILSKSLKSREGTLINKTV